MRRASRAAIIVIAAVIAGGTVIYLVRRPQPPGPIIGVVRSTEVRVEPEVNGQLVSIAVQKGAQVHAGEVLAKLDAVELTAQLDQARAAQASATANRNNVYAGVRHEQVDSLQAQIAKAKARLEYVQLQLTRTRTLASSRVPLRRTEIASTRALPARRSRSTRRVFSYVRTVPITGKVRWRRSGSTRIAPVVKHTRSGSRPLRLKRGNPTRLPTRVPARALCQFQYASTAPRIPSA